MTGSIGRKPKGWYRRYEIIWELPDFGTGQNSMRWVIIRHLGRNLGAAYCGNIGASETATDDEVIRRAGCNTVTVPVYVVRPEATTVRLPHPAGRKATGGVMARRKNC